MAQSVELVLDTHSELGEGAIWHHRLRRLYWVDIERNHVYIYDPDRGSNRTIDVGERVGTVVPRRTGGLLLALQHGLAALDTDSEKLTRIVDPESGVPENRFNDGKCDPAGRFWAGTLAMAGKRGTAALYRLDTDLSVKQMVRGVTISNGIAWSLDKKTMYYIDTPTQQVVSYSYDDETGDIADRAVAVSIPEDMGFPDGMTIDEQGKLWIALFRGSALTRWDPKTGHLLDRVPIPASNVTSCALGGVDLRDMYVTTARTGLSNEEHAAQPHAGGTFRFRADVPGIPAFEFSG